MRAIVRIDVSKASSEVAFLVNNKKAHDYTMPNDAVGFLRLFGDLKTVHQLEILFGVTGYAYTRVNPLDAKKQRQKTVAFLMYSKDYFVPDSCFNNCGSSSI